MKRPVFAVCLVLAGVAAALAAASRTTLDAEFPPELVDFVPYEHNPVFQAEGPGHWDVRIRERGWILREGDTYYLWFTGYDGTAQGRCMLGLATSSDGVHWQPNPDNPIYRDHWVEDMMVVKHGDTYYMFAEGLHDRAQLLTSKDRVHWTRVGQLDIRYRNGEPLSEGPFGTPTAWLEGGTWYLFYERSDRGIWLAASKDLKVWTNVQDEPVIEPGPGAYDRDQVALNQIVRYQGRYYAYYHGAAIEKPTFWTTNVATSSDLIHWKKYPGNPIQPKEQNKSSGILVHDGAQYRLYTMHPSVWLHFPRGMGTAHER